MKNKSKTRNIFKVDKQNKQKQKKEEEEEEVEQNERRNSAKISGSERVPLMLNCKTQLFGLWMSMPTGDRQPVLWRRKYIIPKLTHGEIDLFLVSSAMEFVPNSQDFHRA